MSDAADQAAQAHVSWARPGGRHDRLVRFLGWALPIIVGILIAVLALAPLWNREENSFVLQKDGLEKADQPMLSLEAAYRGEDDQGRAFLLKGDSAVQKNPNVPIIELHGLTGQLVLRDGLAEVESESGLYNLKTRDVSFPGSVQFVVGDKYRLNTSNIEVDLNSKRGYSNGPVTGSVPIAVFSAGRMTLDLETRTVVLEGRARGRIVQGALKK